MLGLNDSYKIDWLAHWGFSSYWQYFSHLTTDSCKIKMKGKRQVRQSLLLDDFFSPVFSLDSFLNILFDDDIFIRDTVLRYELKNIIVDFGKLDFKSINTIYCMRVTFALQAWAWKKALNIFTC